MTPKNQKAKIPNAKKDAATQMTPKITKPAAASQVPKEPKDDENKTTSKSNFQLLNFSIQFSGYGKINKRRKSTAHFS
jgi:hypothetical protein